MPFQPGHTPAHKGMRIVTTPIKEYNKVQEVKAGLRQGLRALALFTLDCNSAFRAGDMLRLKRDQLTLQEDVRYEIATVEQKTQKLRRIVLSGPASRVLREHIEGSSGSYVFEGQRGKMSVSYLRRLIKQWCAEAGVHGHIATHTMRKSS